MAWLLERGRLVQDFVFKNFLEAIEFVNKIVPIAQELDHHPDVFIHSYKKVKVILFSHDAGKVTDKDRALAKRIDSI